MSSDAPAIWHDVHDAVPIFGWDNAALPLTTPAVVTHQLDREHTCVERAASLLSSDGTDSSACPAQPAINFDIDPTLVLDRFRTADLWGSAN